ncbi:MAG TPA: hypothetical protein VF203_01590 [Burkholderiales bacterium]
MRTIDPTHCRLETLLGALLYMMTAYQKNCCRQLARSIAAHLECLAHHPDAAETVRQVAGGMCEEWKRASAGAVAPVADARAPRMLH